MVCRLLHTGPMRICVWLLTSLLGPFATGLLGATLERLTLDDMTTRSTAIVRGLAMPSSTVQIGPTIYTKTRFQVLERLKGPNSPEIDVFEPGGTVGKMTQMFPGAPRFNAGQELLLFLWTGPSGRTQVIGLSQGVFEVSHNAASGETEVSRQPSGEMMLAPRPAGAPSVPVQEEAISMPLGRMVVRIQSALVRGALDQNGREQGSRK
jgi:hypothetical protein